MKRELNLPADLWAAFDRAAEIRGSHEAVLRYWLSAGGVFETDEATKILTGPGNTIRRTKTYLKHLESQKQLEAQRGRMTTLDAVGIDRSSRTGKASLEAVQSGLYAVRGKRKPARSPRKDGVGR